MRKLGFETLYQQGVLHYDGATGQQTAAGVAAAAAGIARAASSAAG